MWVWKIRCSNKLAIDIYRLRDTDDCISLSTNFQIKPTCATVKTWQKVDMVRSHTVKKNHCRSMLESLLTDSWIDDLPPNTSNLSMFWLEACGLNHCLILQAQVAEIRGWNLQKSAHSRRNFLIINVALICTVQQTSQIWINPHVFFFSWKPDISCAWWVSHLHVSHPVQTLVSDFFEIEDSQGPWLLPSVVSNPKWKLWSSDC